jgi:hypothetical protein
VYNNTLYQSNTGISIETRGDISGAVFINNLGDGTMNINGATNSHNGNYPIDENYVPTVGSGAIDGGIEISPYTDGFAGLSPDIGAYEYGGNLWQPGADIPDYPLGIQMISPQIPRIVLYQNYPNPFNPLTIISYELPNTNHTELSIYNVLGQKVATLVSENQKAGHYYVQWDASAFPSGLYFYRLQTDYFLKTKKLLLLK